MLKRILTVSLLAIVSFFVSCSQEEQVTPDIVANQSAAPKSVPIVQVDAFTAPSSPVVTADQAKRYAKASAALIELGVRWTDRIDKAQDAEKVQILNAYNVARDQLCARVGLAGIAEYNWITSVALPNPQNKATFEAVGVQVP
ncbi:MAG: hypothetical protein K6E57_08960 [Fibrobacter sp.]|nr:hypothetical protein [Fibrobacter sp.]MCR5379066.1 hypothetical protein [Fibrobacter sp.]